MAITDRYTGANWGGTWIYSGGTVTLSGDQTTFSVERSADVVDITAANEASRSYAATLKDAKYSLDRFDTGTNGTALAAAVKEAVTGTLTWGPLGTATGKPKFSTYAIVTGHKIEFPFDDRVMLSIEWQGSGTLLSDYGAVY